MTGFIFISCFISAFLIASIQGQVSITTVTEVKTVSTTTTVILPTNTICASLVNATSFCRRRRDYWIDAPVVIALDDDVDEKISQFFSKPTNTFQVEPTQVPMQMRTDDLNDTDTSIGPISYSVIQPSMFSINNSRIAEPFLFGSLANLINSLIRRGQTVVTQVTSTVTRTVSLFVTTGTKPIIIQGCIPSSLPFPKC